MKLYSKIVFFALLAISIASCSKDNSSTPAKMSATIDGKTWSPPDLGVMGTFSSSTGVFTITGITGTSSISIIIHGETTSTYTLSIYPVKTECEATYIPSLLSYSDAYFATSGTVVLTKVDKTKKLISGTFEYTLSNSKTITKGQFNDVTYQ